MVDNGIGVIGVAAITSALKTNTRVVNISLQGKNMNFTH
jgi:hypothetical protein